MLILPKTEEDGALNSLPILYWNHVGLEMNRITHSLGGPQAGPTMSSRALGLLHLAMHDAYFGCLRSPDYGSYLKTLPPLESVPQTHEAANLALTGAAVTVLDQLYRFTGSGISRLATDTLTSMLSTCIRDFSDHIDTLDVAYNFGEQVARAIIGQLGVKPGQLGADQGRYEPRNGRYYFRDEPANPVRRVDIDPDHPERGQRSTRMYHGPFYGLEVEPFDTTADDHRLAPPPRELGHGGDQAQDDAYKRALREVIAFGGAPGRAKTARNADQTVQALYWAYDGANLIGTPPRLYNQIIRKIAWDRKPNNAEEATAEFVRLFALVNIAMADAGKYAWKEKYQYQLWRPLSGVREHDSGADPLSITVNAKLDPDADPFWQALGAPETNTNKISFKPPFPAYPSGHATFGAACFQMARLFYKKRDGLEFDDNAADNIEFTFVSDELNGINRDLYQPHDPSLPIEEQPGLVRTRVNRRYPSLWHAIFENALSRIYLGVHWHFDAFALADVEGEPKDPKDTKEGEVCYKDPSHIQYSNVWTPKEPKRQTSPVGGVPLGLGVANEIWSRWTKRDEEANKGELPETAPAAEFLPQTEQLLKSSNTNIR